MLVKVLPKLEKNGRKTLPAVGKLLDLSADHLVLMAFKQSEDDSNVWILRCYECRGEEAKLKLKSDLGLAISQPVDLLDRTTHKFAPEVRRWAKFQNITVENSEFCSPFILNKSSTPQLIIYGRQRAPYRYQLRILPHRKFIQPFETLGTWCQQNLSTYAN